VRVPPRRMHALSEVNLVSLGDIAFNCIIFFILTTSFIKGSRNVELPKLPPSEKTPGIVSVTLDATGRIQLDGQDIDTPEGLSARLTQRLQSYTDPKAREVKLRCDARLTQATYRPVIEAIANAGGIIAIIHQPGTTPEYHPAPLPAQAKP
jgi:biopolymer transport protein ExbD